MKLKQFIQNKAPQIFNKIKIKIAEKFPALELNVNDLSFTSFEFENSNIQRDLTKPSSQDLFQFKVPYQSTSNCLSKIPKYNFSKINNDKKANIGMNNGHGDTEYHAKDNLNGSLNPNFSKKYDQSWDKSYTTIYNLPEDNRAKHAKEMFELYTTSIDKKDSNTQKILLEGYQYTLESEAFKPHILKQEDNNDSNSGSNTFKYPSFTAGILAGGSLIGFITYYLNPNNNSEANVINDLELSGVDDIPQTESM